MVLLKWIKRFSYERLEKIYIHIKKYPDLVEIIESEIRKDRKVKKRFVGAFIVFYTFNIQKELQKE
jgi:hypothetical protein